MMRELKLEIASKIELDEAKAKLEKLIDLHKYNQMLVGNSKIPPDPEILWLHTAIELFEKENPITSRYHGGYPTD